MGLGPYLTSVPAKDIPPFLLRGQGNGKSVLAEAIESGGVIAADMSNYPAFIEYVAFRNDAVSAAKKAINQLKEAGLRVD